LRVFLSYSRKDSRQARALKQWSGEKEPALAHRIYLDVDEVTGIKLGTRWKEELKRECAQCEAVICLLSRNWGSSAECRAEYRTAENLDKLIFCARLEPTEGSEFTGEWQRCDLFGEGPVTEVDVGVGTPVVFATAGLNQLRRDVRAASVGVDNFAWPPKNDPSRAPYRGCYPFEVIDAGVFFGRDGQIVRALDRLRGMRKSAPTCQAVASWPPRPRGGNDTRICRTW
jgi:hypothetical protein